MLNKILDLIRCYQITKFIKKAIDISYEPPDWMGSGFGEFPEDDENPFSLRKRFSYPPPGEPFNRGLNLVPGIDKFFAEDVPSEVKVSPLDIETEVVSDFNKKERLSRSASLLAMYLFRRSLDVPTNIVPRYPIAQLSPLPALKKPIDYARYGFPAGLLRYSADLQSKIFPTFLASRPKDWLPNVIKDFFKLDLDLNEAEYFIHRLDSEVVNIIRSTEKFAYRWSFEASSVSGLGDPNTVSLYVAEIPSIRNNHLTISPVGTIPDENPARRFVGLGIRLSDILPILERYPENHMSPNLVVLTWYEIDKNALRTTTPLENLPSEFWNKIAGGFTMLPIAGDKYGFTEAFWFGGRNARNTELHFSIKLQPQRFSFFYGKPIEPLKVESLFLAHPENKDTADMRNPKPDFRHLLLLKLKDNQGQPITLFSYLRDGIQPIITKEGESIFQKFKPIIEDEVFVERLSKYTSDPQNTAQKIRALITENSNWSGQFLEFLLNIVDQRYLEGKRDNIDRFYEEVIEPVARFRTNNRKVRQYREEFAGRMARLLNYMEAYSSLHSAHFSTVELSKPVEQRRTIGNDNFSIYATRIFEAMPFIQVKTHVNEDVSPLDAVRLPTVHELAFLTIGGARLNERYGNETFPDIQRRIHNFRSEFEGRMVSGMEAYMSNLEREYIERLRSLPFQEKVFSLSRSISALYQLRSSLNTQRFALRNRIAGRSRRR